MIQRARQTVRAAWRWGRTRPWGLAPWIGLAATVILWPGRRPSPPGMSEDRVMSPEDFEQAEPGRGRAAAFPHAIPLIGWRDILWRTAREIYRDRLPSTAGGVTFYALLAIFPAIGAFVSLYGLLWDVAAVQTQLQGLSGVFPGPVIQIVGDQMLRLAGQHPGRLSAAFLLSLLISVWSATAGMRALFEGLNIAYDEVETRPLLRRTLFTYGSTFAALVFLALVAGVLVAAPLVLSWVGLARADSWWFALRWCLVAAVTVGVFSLVYRYGPSRARARWRWVIWGAALSSAGWLGGSLVFSWYVANVAQFDVTYGSLGAVVGFMLWLWVSVIVLLVGAELNAEIEHQTAVDTTTGPDRPMGQRGATMADTVGQPLHLRETLRVGAGHARRQAGGLWARVSSRRTASASRKPGRGRS